jgi:hypothetical protein
MTNHLRPPEPGTDRAPEFDLRFIKKSGFCRVCNASFSEVNDSVTVDL